MMAAAVQGWDTSGMTTRPFFPFAKHDNTSYVRGCRCEECSEVHSAYNRSWRARPPVDPDYEPPMEEINGTIEHFMTFVEETAGCWYWLGQRQAYGYGRYHHIFGRGPGMAAHRFSHLMFIGPIPEGYEVDHVCHNVDPLCVGGDDCSHRACVNPEHLEAVTTQENARRRRFRKTHCPHGHEWTPENTYIRPSDGARSCLECYRLDQEYAREAGGYVSRSLWPLTVTDT